MVQAKWQTFEDQVRGIAALIFGKPCEPGRIAGVNFDGLIRKGELELVLIEISLQQDLDKVRQGIVRLTLARQALVAEGVVLRGYIVLRETPTKAMLDAATESKLTVLSAGQFGALFFHFPRYNEARVAASFGSSIDPLTGDVDRVNYVPVLYERVDGRSDIGVAEIADSLLSGQNVILLGEYGSGKS